MRPRVANIAIVAIASVGLAVAGCTNTPAAQSTPTPTESATDILNAAAAKTKDQSFKYTLTYGTLVSGQGAQDASGKNAQADLTIHDPASGIVITANVLVVGNAMFMKLNMGAFPIPGLGRLGDKWMRVDRAKMRPSGLAQGLTPGGDSLTADAYIKGVATAEAVSPTEIKGTLDLTKSAPAAKLAARFANLGPAKSVVPFVATLDADGRINKIVISMPASGSLAAADMVTTYSDYGSAIEVAAPAAGGAVTAPALIYNFL